MEKDLKGIKGRFYISRLIEEGEHERQDFKFAVSDARKIARSISAFANRLGGRLLIGVKDNGAIAGVRNEEDLYVIEQAATMYCRPEQSFRVTAFRTEADKTVMRVEIDPCPDRPVEVVEADGSLRAYYRVKDENILAPPLMVRAWREANTSPGTLLNLDTPGRTLLALMADGPVGLEDYMIKAHVSRALAEDTAVRLHALGLLDFVYDGHRFLLAPPPAPADR